MVTIAYYTFVKLIECTPRVNSVVNDRFCMIMICQGGFIDCNNVPLWCGMLIARRLCLCEVKGVYGNCLYFLLNIGVKLKL